MSLSVPRDLTLVWETTVSATSNSIVAKGYQSVGISWSDPSSSLQENECGWFSAARCKRQFWVVVGALPPPEGVHSIFWSYGCSRCTFFIYLFGFYIAHVDKQPLKVCQDSRSLDTERNCSLSQQTLSISVTVSYSEKFILEFWD